MINGADASNLNGVLNWPVVARDHNLSFAFVKATEGRGFRDPLFPAFWAALKALGLTRGAYAFGHPVTDATAQADAFLSYVRASGLDDGDILALDLEVTDGRKPADVAAWSREFCGRVTAQAARPVLVYTFLSFAEAGNCAGLEVHPLWIADPSSPPGRPRVPAPWSRWAVHQHGQQGLDLDIAAYPDASTMRAALARPGTPPAQTGWTSRMIADLPVLAQGADDAHLPHWYVHRAQAIANSVFHAAPALTVDGKFGPATRNAIEVIQRGCSLPVTGDLDAATWTLLLAGAKP